MSLRHHSGVHCIPSPLKTGARLDISRAFQVVRGASCPNSWIYQDHLIRNTKTDTGHKDVPDGSVGTDCFSYFVFRSLFQPRLRWNRLLLIFSQKLIAFSNPSLLEKGSGELWRQKMKTHTKLTKNKALLTLLFSHSLSRMLSQRKFVIFSFFKFHNRETDGGVDR